MRPDKVIITVTPEGEKIEVFDDMGYILSSRETKMISAGEARTTAKGDIYDDIPSRFDDLAEAIDDTQFSLFSVAQALYLAKEEIG